MSVMTPHPVARFERHRTRRPVSCASCDVVIGHEAVAGLCHRCAELARRLFAMHEEASARPPASPPLRIP